MVQVAYLTTITSNTTLTIDYDTYIINISSNITVTLPNITCDGITINLKRIDVTTNTLTINCTGGQLINGSATLSINYNGEITFISLDGNWVTANMIDAITVGGNYNFVFPNGGNPSTTYVSSGPSGTSASIYDFYYPGSNNNGGIPTFFAVIFDIPNAGVYKFDLIHLSGGTGVALGSIIATVSTATTPSAPTIISTSTITLSNVSTTECIWELKVTKQSGNQGTRVYNCFIGL